MFLGSPFPIKLPRHLVRPGALLHVSIPLLETTHHSLTSPTLLFAVAIMLGGFFFYLRKIQQGESVIVLGLLPSYVYFNESH